ncbi:TIGR01906 family membrane protein [Streptococcaceae bacterium ESL0687]|nr:TIGR01906 family membrane protein [Streptococcaceae bacterium ESL0687]
MKNSIKLIFTVLFVISFSVCLTIILAIPLYRFDINHLKITEYAYQTKKTLMDNFTVLMKYLLNPNITRLNMPDFKSSREGLKHFKDVKNLFQLTFIVMLVSLPFFLSFIKCKLSLIYRNVLKMFFYLPFFLGIFTLFNGFDSIFIAFHKLVFSDDTWIFNPYTDPVITILPEAYFMHCFIIFILIYLLIFYWLYKLAERRMRSIKKASQ